MERLLKALVIIMICQTSLPAQVRLLLDYNARTDEYTVSMMPEKTWVSPNNLTATGQVTLKATTGQFFVKSIKSFLPGTNWNPYGRVNAPIESPKHDYIFFGLEIDGFAELPYKAFSPTRLFSFKLESNCAREVSLVSNYEDKFLPPNSRSINIGNSLGVSGANGEAYTGNVSDMPIMCPYASIPNNVTETEGETDANTNTNTDTDTDAEENGKSDQPKATLLIKKEVVLTDKVLYPNPTINEVNIKLNWGGQKGEKTILVYNNTGELAQFFVQDLQKGSNEFTLDVSELASGVYNFLLVEKGKSLPLGHIIKVQ